MAQVLKEEVRNRILEAAEKVFYKKDYRGAKLTEIAKEADIPVALIYTYFKNKEVLFDAVVSSVYINFESAFNEEESLEKGSASERFDEVGENYIHELVELEVSRTEKYYAILKEKGKITGSVSHDLHHMITSAYFTAVFETIVHDMSREQAIEYVEELAIFFNSGWEGLLRLT